MTWEEAEEAAIAAGALKPYGTAENVAAAIGQNWHNTPKAKGRLSAWTRAILEGMNPSDCKRMLG